MAELFDKIAGAVEEQLPALKPVLEEAALFEFPGRPQDILHLDYPSTEEIDFLAENFSLPFPVTAIEDTAGLVIFIDEPGEARGFSHPRRFVEAYRTDHGRIDGFDICLDEHGKIVSTRSPEIQTLKAKMKQVFPEESIKISIGILASFRILPKLKDDPESAPGQYWGKVTKTLVIHRKEGVICGDESWAKLPRNDRRIMDTETMRNVTAGMQELIWADSPKRFIVESEPRKKRKNKQNRLLRTQERNRYRILDPGAALKYMGVDPLGKGTPLDEGHRRKAHWRTYRAARFIHMKGKTQRVKATWVGPLETSSKSGRTVYRVRLDL